MSKLLEQIERAGKAPPAPLGFGASQRQQKVPALVVVAACEKPTDAVVAAEAGANAVLFLPGKKGTVALPAEAGDKLGTTPWGVVKSDLTSQEAEQLQSQGCDFIVVDADASLAALHDRERGPGRVLRIAADLDEKLTRTLEDLPIDAVLVETPHQPPWTLHHLMLLSAIRLLVGKPFLLGVSGTPSPWEVECLRDIGVDGLVLNADTAKREGLLELRKAVNGLPQRKPRGDRPSPLLPHVQGTMPAPPEEEEEEEESF
ncbi:MAG: hypothetical protein HY683_10660 [Chloroflexi bacterium]|nr:hypothetical protein [Chloroflexota bacterium]